jgi:hypothetical protein
LYFDLGTAKQKVWAKENKTEGQNQALGRAGGKKEHQNYFALLFLFF